MTTSTRVAPPHSLVLVGDSNDLDIPDAMQGSLISSTESCIAIGCRSEIDGETELTLGASREVDPGRHPDFEGVLTTPSRRIAVRSVLGQAILEAPVPGKMTKVRVWVNDTGEPDEVIIGIT
jgi:hypothetical protein